MKTVRQHNILKLLICASMLYIFPSNAISQQITSTEEVTKPDKNVTLTKKFLSKKKYTHFTSGTGFFVNEDFIITNEHVVQGCKFIKVRGAVKPSFVTIYAKDKKNDLVLLKSPKSPKGFASLRGDTPIKMGENVTVMGYPLERGIQGQYLVKKATITDTNDSYDGTKRIQFTDSVEKGNSGGPLLDSSGTVIGVVVGKMSFYLADADLNNENSKPVKTSSMAISLDSLKDFLKNNKINYFTDNVNYNYVDSWVESKAKQYVVNIHCVKK